MSQALITAITEMQEEEAVALAQQMLDSGAAPAEVLDACKQAMDVIGQRFEKGECFIPELILAGEMLSQIAAIVKPRIQQGAGEKKLGKVVFGTVAGDIHDIAKAVRKSRAGLKDPKRPIGSFIFAGPTGVGKTEIARRLATLTETRARVQGIPADERVASAYARLAAQALEAGRRPRVHDTWIAATAVVHDAEVWTRDADFSAFAGVAVVHC